MKHKRIFTTVMITLLIVPLLVVAITENRARRHTGADVSSFAELLGTANLPLNVTKLSGVWKYKSPSIETSEQVCVVGGNYPTSLQNFNNMTPTTFTVKAEAWHSYSPGYTDDYSGFTHTFGMSPAELKGDGTSCSLKFLDYPSVKSELREPKPVKYGTFKAKIKNGRMFFIYSIPKANDGGLMVETDTYSIIQERRTQDWFKSLSKEKVTGGAQVWFRAGPESSYGEAECDVKIGMSSGKGKIGK